MSCCTHATDHAHHGSAAHDPAHGHGHGHGEHHDHEPAIMIAPLTILALGAVLVGAALVYHHNLANFLGQSPSFALAYEKLQLTVQPPSQRLYPPMHFGQHHVQGQVERTDKAFVEAQHKLHTTVMIASTIVALLGVWFAYLLHLKDRTAAERLASERPGVVRLLEAKYWIDEIYAKGVVAPLRGFGQLFFAMDRVIVDGIVFLVSFIPELFGHTMKLTTQQHGNLQGYAVTMLFGVAVILLVVFL